MNLTIQALLDGGWVDIAELTLNDPGRGRYGTSKLAYSSIEHTLEYLARRDTPACSINLPVAIAETYRRPTWFTFLDDIIPSGAARRYWVQLLGLSGQSGPAQDSELLSKGTIAPIGNLRIKEALPEKVPGSQLRQYRFNDEDVCERQTDFLEYAQEMGAASGGATGAGGEAPKLLLRRSSKGEVWIDTWQDDACNLDQHYLVKFPRNNRSEIDCDILRAEYHYYLELDALGVETVDVSKLRLLEGSTYPSLWIPRFDVSYETGREQRFGLESIYSVMEQEPGSFLNHFDVLRKLVEVLHECNHKFDSSTFVAEWVRRDLLNVAFGNSDNHGRNSALLKRPHHIDLAPVYDFAPMKADPEGITRTTKWGIPFEEGGNFNWINICNELSDIADPAQILNTLKAQASALSGLGQRLRNRGVSSNIINMPTFGFSRLDEKLKRWELLT